MTTTMKQAARSQKWYGCRPDTPDLNDHEFRDAFHMSRDIPETLDLRASDFGGVYDQGDLGSCTANGSLGAYRDLLVKEQIADFNGSRLAQYWWTRFLEGTTDSDAGAEIRDAVKVLAKRGVAPEKDWPYVISKFGKRPPAVAARDAKKHLAISYERVNLSEIAIKTALLANANVVIGISVYASFESVAVAKTGIVPMPKKGEALLGGHCMRVRGWRDMNGTPYWIVANSWGASWGDSGYCYLPLDYLTSAKLASDFWTLSACK